MKEAIESKDLSSYEDEYKKDKSHKVIERTVTHNGLYNSAIDKETFDSLTDTFSIDVKAGSVTNQKQSGRCWMFAGLNVLRTILMKKLNIKNIELSQAYLQFYDKLEKSNATLERAMLLLDEPVEHLHGAEVADLVGGGIAVVDERGHVLLVLVGGLERVNEL